MRRDGMRRVGDVAEVGLVIFVERRRDADDNRIHGADLRIVGRGFEAVGFGGRDLLGRNTDNIGAAAREGVDLSLIDIEPGDGKFLLAVEQRQWQSDVAKSDDPHLGLARTNAAFQVGEKRRSNELSIHRVHSNLNIAGFAHGAETCSYSRVSLYCRSTLCNVYNAIALHITPVTEFRRPGFPSTMRR